MSKDYFTFDWQRKDSSCPRINFWGSHWNDEFSEIFQSWTLAQVQELALEWWWGIRQFLVGITVAKKLKLMQFAAFRLYVLFITKQHIITTYIFVYLWWVNSLIHVLYCRTALQTCVEVSEMLRQFEGKTGGEVLHPFVEPDILNSCCKPYCLCWPKCSPKAATTPRCSWRTDLEVHRALARGSGSRVAEGSWKPCSAVSQTLLRYSLLSLIQIWECPIWILIGTHRRVHGGILGGWDIIYISQRAPASCSCKCIHE